MDKAAVERIRDKALEGWPIPDDPRFPPSLYYRFLYWLTVEMKARTCVELGVCGGGASRAMCDGQKVMALSDGIVFGVDLDHAWDDRMAELLKEHQNFRFFFGDSAWESVHVFSDQGDREVDILFIDTTHTRERTTDEYKAWKGVLAPKALVVLDDVNRPGMSTAIDEICQDGWEYVGLDLLHDGAGFGAMIR